jgi:hypothetical protein
MRDELLIRALSVLEEPNPEPVHHIQIVGQFHAAREVHLQFHELIEQLVMLVPVRCRVLVAGFGKEPLFMVEVKAGEIDQLFKDAFERRPGADGHNSVEQFIDQEHQFFVVVIQQLHAHAHAICPDNQRHICTPSLYWIEDVSAAAADCIYLHSVFHQ